MKTPKWLRALLNLPEPEQYAALYGPLGVTLTYGDGAEFTDVPSIYVGHYEADGTAVYELLPPRDANVDKPVAMSIDVIPPMTSIIFPFDGTPRWTGPEQASITPVDPGTQYED
jgi:hypothetical protein